MMIDQVLNSILTGMSSNCSWWNSNREHTKHFAFTTVNKESGKYMLFLLHSEVYHISLNGHYDKHYPTQNPKQRSMVHALSPL